MSYLRRYRAPQKPPVQRLVMTGLAAAALVSGYSSQRSLGMLYLETGHPKYEELGVFLPFYLVYLGVRYTCTRDMQYVIFGSVDNVA